MNVPELTDRNCSHLRIDELDSYCRDCGKLLTPEQTDLPEHTHHLKWPDWDCECGYKPDTSQQDLPEKPNQRCSSCGRLRFHDPACSSQIDVVAKWEADARNLTEADEMPQPWRGELLE